MLHGDRTQGRKRHARQREWRHLMRLAADVWDALGEVNRGFHQLMWELQGERLIGAIGAVAGAQAALDYTLEYCRQRVLFGRPLVGFQVTGPTCDPLVAERTPYITISW